MSIILCAFGTLLLVWALYYVFSFNNPIFLPLSSGIISFVSGLPYTLIIMLGVFVLIFAFELFYFKTEGKATFYIYYLFLAPILTCAVTLWLSSSVFPISLGS